MGHEYVELKNTAAVDAYRHAVDINPKDYRAWHELNPSNSAPRACTPARSDAPHPPSQVRARADVRDPADALLRAFLLPEGDRLRPYDSRMWCAMAGCYKGLQRMKEAIQCYQVAAALGDPRGLLTSHPIRTPPPPPPPPPRRSPTACGGEHGSRRHRASGARADLQGGGGHAACGHYFRRILELRQRARRRRAGGAGGLSFLANFCKGEASCAKRASIARGSLTQAASSRRRRRPFSARFTRRQPVGDSASSDEFGRAPLLKVNAE